LKFITGEVHRRIVWKFLSAEYLLGNTSVKDDLEKKKINTSRREGREVRKGKR